MTTIKLILSIDSEVAARILLDNISELKTSEPMLVAVTQDQSHPKDLPMSWYDSPFAVGADAY